MYNILVKNIAHRRKSTMKDKISLAGDLGSGKSTVSKHPKGSIAVQKNMLAAFEKNVYV